MMIALYYQARPLISFWCKQELNPISRIHFTALSLRLQFWAVFGGIYN